MKGLAGETIPYLLPHIIYAWLIQRRAFCTSVLSLYQIWLLFVQPFCKYCHPASPRQLEIIPSVGGNSCSGGNIAADCQPRTYASVHACTVKVYGSHFVCVCVCLKCQQQMSKHAGPARTKPLTTLRLFFRTNSLFG